MTATIDYSKLNLDMMAKKSRWPMATLAATGMVIVNNVVLNQPAAVFYRQSTVTPKSADYSLLAPTRQMEWDLIKSDEDCEAVQSYFAFTNIIVRYLTAPETTAPIWLLKRMETLRQMPPPTLQEVRTQLKASAETRKKSTDRQLVS
jgi:hypothetical protein